MELRQVIDDFIKIGNVAVLQRKTGNDVYDFEFRNNFDCKSVVTEIEEPVLLHIGAIEDYAGIENMMEQMGMKLLIHEAEHLRCSTIEGWYSALKDKTPFTRIYDELPPVDELLKDFTFPVFIKGNQQTNRHKKSQCIIENKEAYEVLRNEWYRDNVLSWQKVAVREYVPLQTIDETSYPDMVPISYEFRFFYFEGNCMAYGPYWYMGPKYSLCEDEVEEVLKLTDWAADRLGVTFPAIDVAKTASGEWIIIEVNDAQESGFVGVNPIVLWKNIIEAIQNRNKNHLEEMWEKANNLQSIQELVDVFVAVHNKFWQFADGEYDYDEGTEDYKKACAITEAWGELMDSLEKKVFEVAKKEGLLAERQENSGTIKQIEDFMKKYGYRDGRGWWIRIKEN